MRLYPQEDVSIFVGLAAVFNVRVRAHTRAHCFACVKRARTICLFFSRCTSARSFTGAHMRASVRARACSSEHACNSLHNRLQPVAVRCCASHARATNLQWSCTHQPARALDARVCFRPNAWACTCICIVVCVHCTGVRRTHVQARNFGCH